MNKNDTHIVEQLLKMPDETDPSQWPHTFGEARGAERWVAICLAVAQHQQKPGQKLLYALLEAINGMRRIPGIRWIAVLQKLNEFEVMLDAAQRENISWRRTAELYHYHRGITQTMMGSYAKAANEHQMAYNNARTRLGQYIQHMLELECRAYLAFVHGKNTKDIPAFFEAAELLYNLAAEMPGLIAQRWVLQAKIRFLVFEFLFWKEISNTEMLTVTVDGIAKENSMHRELLPAAELLEAIDHYAIGYWDEALTHIKAIPDGHEYWMYGQFVAALTYLRMGRGNTGIACLRTIVAEKRMTHYLIAAAVAHRELQEITAIPQ